MISDNGGSALARALESQGSRAAVADGASVGNDGAADCGGGEGDVPASAPGEGASDRKPSIASARPASLFRSASSKVNEKI